MFNFINFWGINLLLYAVSYDCEWYKLSRVSVTLLHVMMLRSIKSCSLTGGKMFTLCMETYSAVRKNMISITKRQAKLFYFIADDENGIFILHSVFSIKSKNYFYTRIFKIGCMWLKLQVLNLHFYNNIKTCILYIFTLHIFYFWSSVCFYLE